MLLRIFTCWQHESQQWANDKGHMMSQQAIQKTVQHTTVTERSNDKPRQLAREMMLLVAFSFSRKEQSAMQEDDDKETH